jgi:glutamate-1-semialdehyde 2,1-aminomutase
LQMLRELCTAHGALLIFDEVMTGFRVARGGMQELAGIRADLTAMGKVIGGGLPVGAFGGRADVMDHLAPDGPVYQAGTLSGNPLAMAAGLAQLRELERSDAWQRLEELGAQLENGVRVEAAAAGCTIQRAGSMFSLFFTEGPVRNLEEATKSDTAKFGNFFHYCLDHGVYFPPSQFETGFISTAHTGEDIARTVGVVAQALRHAA